MNTEMSGRTPATLSFTRSACHRFATAIWGPHTDALRDTNAVIAVCDDRRGPGSFAARAFPAAHDVDAIVAASAANAAPTFNTYIGINPMRMPEPTVDENGHTKRGRGGDDDVIGVVALYADIDTADGVHAANVKAKKALPTRERVGEWLSLIDSEVTVSVVVSTGGGVHIYVVLDEMLDPRDAFTAKLMRDFATVVERLAHRDGVFTDGASITCNLSRVLRPAGAWNAKRVRKEGAATGDRVTLQHVTDSPPQPVEEIEEGLAALLAKLPAVPPPADTRPERRPSTPRDPSAPELIGTRFALAYPADWLLIEAMGARRVKKGLALPRADGSYDVAPSIAVYGGGSEPVYVTAFGARSIEVLRQGDRLEKHSLSSFALLAEVWCGYNFKTATKLLIAFEGQEDFLIPWLRYWRPGEPMPDELAKFVGKALAARPRTRTRTVRPTQQGAAA